MSHLCLAALLSLAPVGAHAEEPASCLVPGPGADGKGCAGAYKKVTDGFVEGTKAWDAWVAQAASQVDAAADKVAKAEDAIKDNEAAITKLKLERSKDAKLKLAELNKANKQLWKDHETASREQDVLCKGFSKAASMKLKELLADLTKRLQEAQKAAQ